MPSEDDFSRAHDPLRRRRAAVAGTVCALGVAALAVGIWLSRGQSQSTVPPRPSAAPRAFTPLTASPSPVPAQPVVGSGFSAVDDPFAHQLVVFGGIDSYGTTWLWDGHRWRLARPRVSPAGRFNAAAAYDPITHVVMLYGGRLGPGQVVDDTWSWDGRTWHQLDAGTGSPPAGEGSVMAWDSALGEMVLVNGGAGPPEPPAGTWIWRGARWVRQPGTDLPSGTFLVGLAVDPGTGNLLGAGCCSVEAGATSTWSWGATGWHQLSTGGEPPLAVGLALDPVTNRDLIFADPALAPGREMWSWDGRRWNLLAGARFPLFPEESVTDTIAGRLVILGSFAEPVQGHPQPIHVWSWTGSAWQQLG